MIVYHGSNMIVEYPDIKHSFRALDFGKGFYVTTVKEQAERWARRKADICSTDKAIVTVYNMMEDFNELIYKSFEKDLTEWIDFVCRCRDEEKDYLEYDVIKGKVANDKVFNTVELYFEQLIDKAEAINRLRYEKPNLQICFRTEIAMEKYLHFEGSEQI